MNVENPVESVDNPPVLPICGLFERSFRLCFQHPVENFPQNPGFIPKCQVGILTILNGKHFHFSPFLQKIRARFTPLRTLKFLQIYLGIASIAGGLPCIFLRLPRGGVCDIIHLDERRKKSSGRSGARVFDKTFKALPAARSWSCCAEGRKAPVRYPNSSAPAEPPSPTIFPF